MSARVCPVCKGERVFRVPLSHAKATTAPLGRQDDIGHDDKRWWQIVACDTCDAKGEIP